MNKLKMMMAVTAVGSAFVVNAATVTPTGTELVIDVPQGETYPYATLIDTAYQTLRKTGAGTLSLAGANNTFTGKIYIDAGILTGDHGYGTNAVNRSFGVPSEVHIANEARLAIDCKKASANWEGHHDKNYTPFRQTQVFVSGEGPDGNGAISYNGPKVSYNMFGPMTLEGPTTLYVQKCWGFGNKNSPLNCNGYDITIKGTDSFAMPRGGGTFTIQNPGNIYVVSGGLGFDSCPTIQAADGSEPLSNKTIYVSASQNVTVINCDIPYKMHYLGGSNTRMTLSMGWNSNARVPNPISGEGGILKFKTGTTVTKDRKLELLGGVTGLGIEIDDNKLNDYAPITFAGPATNSITYMYWVNGRLLFKGGTMTTFSDKIQVRSPGRSLRFEDAGMVISTWRSKPSSSNNRVLSIWDAPIMVGPQDGKEGANISRMTVSGKTVLTSSHPIESGRCAPLGIAIATHSSTGRGILDVSGGAVMTNDFFTGNDSATSIAAVYLSGNGTQIFTPSPSRCYFGNGKSYSAFEMKGGTFECPATLDFGRGGRGFLVQRGGLVKHESSGFYLGCDTQCYVNCCVLGGEFHNTVPSEPMRLGYNSSHGNATGYTAVFTVGGKGEALANVPGFRAYLATNKTETVRGTSIVNINKDGTLRSGKIFRTAGGDFGKAYPTGNAISPFYVNFNGGTLVTTVSTESFFNEANNDSDAARRQPTRVTVFEGGAVVDTDGHDVGMTTPFEKPYGKGIKSVQLNDSESLTANNSIGTRRVVIAGSGVAADVITDFNLDDRSNAAEAIVTSSGFGYSDADTTAKVESYKDYRAQSNATITAWHDFDSPTYKHGGFTKKGAGTLTLKGANTYGGVTRVEGGTLAFSNASGYPGGDLEFPVSAATNAAAPLVTAQALAFNAAAKIRVTGADMLDPGCCTRFRKLVTCEQAISQLPAIEWVDDAGESVAVRPAWMFRLANGGKNIEFGYSRGTVLTLR